MHASVTALGAPAARVGSAARQVVDYLHGDRALDAGPQRSGSTGAERPEAVRELDGPGDYYADSADQPGVWRGTAAVDRGLGGEAVDPVQLQRALLGRDPISDAVLVQPDGSAGRAGRDRERLTPVTSTGAPDELLDTARAAVLLGVDPTYVKQLCRAGAAARNAQAAAAANGDPEPAMPRSYLDGAKEGDRWVIARGEVERFAATRKQPAVVIGYDVTFSAPKSVSILWATAEPQVRKDIEAAWESAVNVGVGYLERHAAHVRRGRGREPATGLLAASYRHGTNRELEPQLHEHVVIANIATGLDGRSQALDARGLFGHATTAGYLAGAHLRHELTARLGVAWEPAQRGLADIEGIDRTAIDALSTRRRQVLSLATELGYNSPAARQTAALATRAAKDTSVDFNELRDRWGERLADAGFGPAQARQVFDRRSGPRLVSPPEADRLFGYLSSAGGVTELRSIFDRRDVVQKVSEWAGDRLCGDDIERLADRWIASERVVQLAGAPTLSRGDVIGMHGGRGVSLIPDEARFTTPEMLAVERSVLDSYQRGQGLTCGVVHPVVIDRAITTWQTGTGHTLGGDQATMVRAITSSGDRIQCVIGPAGTGKTAALEVASRAWEAAGYRVIGTTVNGTAAEVLAKATGIEAHTVAHLLTRLDTTTRPILDQRTVVLVDEASTLGNRAFARLVRHIEAGGSTLRLIGDPAQHGAVEAGGLFAHLVRTYPERTPALTVNRRQTSDAMADVRLASAEYRDGEIAAAMARLERGDRIVTAPTGPQLLDALAADWYVDRRHHAAEPGPTAGSQMIAEHHHERRELNARAQALLKADGTLTGRGVDIGESTFYVGDEVIALAQHRGLRPSGGGRGSYVRNGNRGTVTKITDPNGPTAGLVVDFEGKGPVTVPHSWLVEKIRPGVIGGITPAYAVTSHAAEGQTFEAGRMLANDTSSTPGVYVGLTRGRSDTRIYTVHAAELDPHRHNEPGLPALRDDRSAVQALTDTLTRPQPVDLATVADPHAETTAQLSRIPLAELRDSDGPLARRAADALEDKIAARAVLQPDRRVVDHLGPRPDDGPARHAWDDAAGALAVYEQRWPLHQPADLREHPDLVPPLPVGSSPEQHAHHQLVVAKITRADVAALEPARSKSSQPNEPGSPPRSEPRDPPAPTPAACWSKTLSRQPPQHADSPTKPSTPTHGTRLSAAPGTAAATPTALRPAAARSPTSTNAPAPQPSRPDGQWTASQPTTVKRPNAPSSPDSSAASTPSSTNTPSEPSPSPPPTSPTSSAPAPPTETKPASGTAPDSPSSATATAPSASSRPPGPSNQAAPPSTPPSADPAKDPPQRTPQ